MSDGDVGIGEHRLGGLDVVVREFRWPASRAAKAPSGGKELWDEWREEFGVRQRQRSTARAGSGGDSRGRTAAAPKLKNQFPGATKTDQLVDAGKTAKKQPPTTTEKFLGAGKPVARPKPKPPDSRVSAEFEPAASKDTPQSRPGYKQRRSAAERKADGSYKPRQRNVPKPKP